MKYSLDKVYNRMKYLIPSLYSLAVFRIVLGISVLYNLIFVKLPYIEEFYGKNTIIPKSLMIEMNGEQSFSILNVIQSDGFAYLLMLFTIAAALSFTLGYKTKLAGFISLFGYWSFLQAGSKFAFGFDFYTIHVLFWAVFLPLDNHFSVSKISRKECAMPSLAFSMALLIQITCVYFFTGLAKYGITWQEGTAITAMLSDVFSVTPLHQYMLPHTSICKMLTYSTLLFEVLSPIMIFASFKNQMLRYFFVIILLGFHLTILSMYKVANFSITGIAVALLLLPDNFWKRLGFVDGNLDKKLTYKSVYIKGFAVIFSIFSIYVIIEKNIFFSTKHTLWKKYNSSQWVSENLSFLDIPSPISISYFSQYWKMFAPNPPFRLGWFTIEKKLADGTFEDILTKKKVALDEYSFKEAWHTKGMERFLLYYSRFYKEEQRGEKFRIYLFYWTLHKLEQNGVAKKAEFSQYYFADYNYILDLAHLDKKPKMSRDISSCSKILLGYE